MAFNNLDKLLAGWEEQPSWANYQQYRTICQAWETIIEPTVARQTRPLYLKRNVLWVATATPAWAQNLTLQRYSLLKQLNARLSEPLADLRFSAALWFRKLAQHRPADSCPQANPISETLAADSSSFISPERPPLQSPTSAQTPESALQNWLKTLSARSLDLSLCPRCQCPTPSSELERWSLCACCAVRQWQDNGASKDDLEPNC